MTGAHIFVDETKHRDYLLVAGVVVPGDLDRLRRTVRGLLLPGQARLHMKAEADARRRLIAGEVARTQVRATVYDAGRRYSTERDRRAACLQALVDDAVARNDSMLVIEQDDPLLSWDNQRLVEATRRANCGPDFRYEHRRARAELLLALPDVVAWCWAKGGDWLRRIEPVVEQVRRV